MPQTRRNQRRSRQQGQRRSDRPLVSPPAQQQTANRRIETVVNVERAIESVRTDRHSPWSKLAGDPCE
jgi:hypothetical protein